MSNLTLSNTLSSSENTYLDPLSQNIYLKKTEIDPITHFTMGILKEKKEADLSRKTKEIIAINAPCYSSLLLQKKSPKAFGLLSSPFTKEKTQRTPVLPISQTPSGEEMISFYASGGKFNKDNANLILNNKAPVNLVSELLSTRTLQEKISLPCSTLLKNPDSEHKIGWEKGAPKKNQDNGQKKLEAVCVTQGTISLGEWLRMKFSKTSWENDNDCRDLIPRLILGILYEGDLEKIQIVNDFLQKINPFHTHPQSLLDLKGRFHQNDDFTITMFTRILYQFGSDPSKIYPETTKSLLTHLLTLDGQDFDDKIHGTQFAAPVSFLGYDASYQGIRNTENHILMINGSAYLKNQFMQKYMNIEDAKYKNADSKLEIGLCNYLDELYEQGLIEFNSIPYAGYTIDALLNLYDFAEEPVKEKSARVLDLIFTLYAFNTSPEGRSFRSFGRQHVKTRNTSFIDDDSVRPFMQAWTGKNNDYYRVEAHTRNNSFALTALTTSYRPPQFAVDALSKKSQSFLSQTGHRFGLAEISFKGFSLNDSYLINGGGTREILSKNPLTWTRQALEQQAHEVIPRPPTLILDGIGMDGYEENDLSRAIFLGTSLSLKNGPGIDAKLRNNSGVFHNFACAAAPVQVPEHIKKHGNSITKDNWTLYEVRPGLTVASYSTENLGLFAIFPNQSPSQALLDALVQKNSNPKNTFTFPSGFSNPMEGSTVHYDIQSSSSDWVITGLSKTGEKEIQFSKKERLLRKMSPQGTCQTSPFDKLKTLEEKPSKSFLSIFLENFWSFIAWLFSFLFSSKENSTIPFNG